VVLFGATYGVDIRAAWQSSANWCFGVLEYAHDYLNVEPGVQALYRLLSASIYYLPNELTSAMSSPKPTNATSASLAMHAYRLRLAGACCSDEEE